MSEKAFRDQEHSWLANQTFVDVQSKQLLDLAPSIPLQPLPRGAPAAWVFDLDSTLFCTAPRNKRVLWRFLRDCENVPGHWMRLWAALTPELQRYAIPQTFFFVFRELGFSALDAEKEARTLWTLYRDFWMREFFLSRNIAFDTPYDGAPSFVREIYNRGYHVVYLTGRDADRAQAGSYEVLKRWGFPMGERSHLWLKPYREQDDLEFKDRASSKLKAQFDVKGLIDNEPENLVMFADRFPEAEVIFFHSIMSQRRPERSFAAALGARKPWRLFSF